MKAKLIENDDSYTVFLTDKDMDTMIIRVECHDRDAAHRFLNDLETTMIDNCIESMEVI